MQPDDRVLTVSDRTILGGKVLYQPSFIEWSAEYSKDVKERPGKTAEEFAALRAVFML
jgi:hypothetical protein